MFRSLVGKFNDSEINPYWDRITLSKRNKSISIFEDIFKQEAKLFSENELRARRLVLRAEEEKLEDVNKEQVQCQEKEKIQDEDEIQSPPVYNSSKLESCYTHHNGKVTRDRSFLMQAYLFFYYRVDFTLSGIIDTFFTIPIVFAEVILKAFAAMIVTGYVEFRDTFKDEGFFGKLALAIPTGIMFIANAFIAQPLFFFANVLLHARAAVDGLIHAVVGLSMDADTLKKGSKALFRGLAYLLVDGLVGAFSFGMSLLCALIPGGQPAVPFFTGSMNLAQSAMAGSISNSISSIAITAGPTAVTAAISQVFVQGGSTLILKKSLKKDESAEAEHANSVAATTAIPTPNATVPPSRAISAATVVTTQASSPPKVVDDDSEDQVYRPPSLSIS